MSKRKNQNRPFNPGAETLDYDEGGFDYTQPNKRVKKGGNGDGESSGGKNEKSSRGSVTARVDPTFGQRSALPGLDDYSKEEYWDEEDEGIGADALKYLRAVRLEATTIPTLLCAPKSNSDHSVYDTGLGDSRGYYKDGAYTAAPLVSASKLPSDEFSDQDLSRDPQLEYFDSILVRFDALRKTLHTTPPRLVVEALGRRYPVHMGASPAEWKSWRWRVLNTDPKMAQLASMQRGTVLKLLRLCTKEFGNGKGEVGVGKRLSMWIWGLLARLPERGELNSEEIGVVRELGKRGVWVSVKIKGVHDLGGLDGGDNVEDGEEEIVEMEVERDDDDGAGMIGPVQPHTATEDTPAAEEEGLEAMRARIIANLSSDSAAAEEPTAEIMIASEVLATKQVEAADEAEAEAETTNENEEESEEDLIRNTKATIDMVITIAGEIYGQRDLLEFREIWE